MNKLLFRRPTGLHLPWPACSGRRECWCYGLLFSYSYIVFSSSRRAVTKLHGGERSGRLAVYKRIHRIRGTKNVSSNADRGSPATTSLRPPVGLKLGFSGSVADPAEFQRSAASLRRGPNNAPQMTTLCPRLLLFSRPAACSLTLPLLSSFSSPPSPSLLGANQPVGDDFY